MSSSALPPKSSCVASTASSSCSLASPGPVDRISRSARRASAVLDGSSSAAPRCAVRMRARSGRVAPSAARSSWASPRSKAATAPRRSPLFCRAHRVVQRLRAARGVVDQLAGLLEARDRAGHARHRLRAPELEQHLRALVGQPAARPARGRDTGWPKRSRPAPPSAAPRSGAGPRPTDLPTRSPPATGPRRSPRLRLLRRAGAPRRRAAPRARRPGCPGRSPCGSAGARRRPAAPASAGPRRRARRAPRRRRRDPGREAGGAVQPGVLAEHGHRPGQLDGPFRKAAQPVDGGL